MNLDRAESLFVVAWSARPGDLRHALEVALSAEELPPPPHAWSPQRVARYATMAAVVMSVSVAYRLPRSVVCGRQRDREAVRPRQVAMWVGHHVGYSSLEIGRYLRRDHTTVLHGVSVIERDEGEHGRIARGILASFREAK